MASRLVRLRLGDADRERLGGPEWVEYDPDVVMAREVCAIYDAWGYSAQQWRECIAARNPLVVVASVWAARRRAGVRESLVDFDFDMSAATEELIGGDPEKPDPGNPPAGEEPAAETPAAKTPRKRTPRKSATPRTTRAR